MKILEKTITLTITLLSTMVVTITQPVLVVNGNNDTMVPTINSYIMFQNLPNAKLTLYPDSGHGAIFQYYEEFFSRSCSFPEKTALIPAVKFKKRGTG